MNKLNLTNIIEQLKGINLNTFNRRSFWFALIGGFAMAFFQNLGISPNFFSPDEKKIVEAVDSIESKLTEKRNTITLTEKLREIPLEIKANAYIVVDMDTHEVLAESNSRTPMAVASLTKVMSSVVALDLAEVSENFTVSEHAAGIIPTKIGVVPGEKMSVYELLQAVMLTSANDATEVMKEGINEKYNEDVFVRAMNIKAEFIGMENTNFTNPQGFDYPEGHYSSAYDLALLSLYAMENYEEIRNIAKEDYAFLPESKLHKQFDLHNWNGLIGVYPNTFGLKTGMTERAGNTTIVMSERDGKRVLVVLLGATSVVERDLQASVLLNAGFSSSNMKPIAVDESMLSERYGRWAFWN